MSENIYEESDLNFDGANLKQSVYKIYFGI